jgi:transglutaminase-like putative cysteine protease
MLIKVSHECSFSFEPPIRSLIQVLRLSPRNSEGQHVLSWRIDVDRDSHLASSEDAFGNLTNTFSIQESISSLTLHIDGEVRTFDTAGVVRGSLERFPPELYLRDTTLTTPDDVLRGFTLEATKDVKPPLEQLHLLMRAIHARMSVEKQPADDDSLTSVQALSSGKGTCRDIAQLFNTCSRVLEIPSRYVSGYLYSEDGDAQTMEHAWAESYVEGLGWVAFDPVLKVCPSECHIRVAVGLDYLGAAPIRSARSLGAGAGYSSKIRIIDAQARSQSQS